MSSKGVHRFGDKQEIELAVCNMNLLVMFSGLGTLSYDFVVVFVCFFPLHWRKHMDTGSYPLQQYRITL